MNFKQFYPGRAIGFVVVLAIVFGVFAVWKLYTSSPSPLSITTTTGNDGLFIDNQDNNYFSTKDANVRNIIKTYLSKEKDYPYEITDAQNYGLSLVYFYNQDVFIAAEKHSFEGGITAFVMHDMKTGQKISDCIIFANAGLYKDTDLLLSVSFIDNGVSPKFGACLYERGAPNFTFIDLTPKLSATETFFSDPAGRDLKANIQDVDTQKKTFTVDVYDTGKKDQAGNYVFRRSLEVSY